LNTLVGVGGPGIEELIDGSNPTQPPDYNQILNNYLDRYHSAGAPNLILPPITVLGANSRKSGNIVGEP
jgi:hypothetical protein